MTRAEQTPVSLRIVIEQPVAGVLHSLQTKDNHPLDAKRAVAGAALAFDVPIRVSTGPKFFGDLVRREGAVRRFVYIAIGTSAGDAASPWTRRMKIDIHDIEPALIDQAIATGGVIELTVNGTGKDGTPACATVPVLARRLVD